MKQVTKGRARRVSRRLTLDKSQDGLVENVEDKDLKVRTVSGETLVNMDNASQSTLVREGIAALDLPWNMSEVFTKQGKEDLLGEKSGQEDELLRSPEKCRGKRRSATERRKGCCQKGQNCREWQAVGGTTQGRREAIYQKIIQSSSPRQGGELMSSIANSVLGKRKERASDGRSGSRSKKLGRFRFHCSRAKFEEATRQSGRNTFV